MCERLHLPSLFEVNNDGDWSSKLSEIWNKTFSFLVWHSLCWSRWGLSGKPSVVRLSWMIADNRRWKESNAALSSCRGACARSVRIAATASCSWWQVRDVLSGVGPSNAGIYDSVLEQKHCIEGPVGSSFVLIWITFEFEILLESIVKDRTGNMSNLTIFFYWTSVSLF